LLDHGGVYLVEEAVEILAVPSEPEVRCRPERRRHIADVAELDISEHPPLNS
jgi:hypothetical protein